MWRNMEFVDVRIYNAYSIFQVLYCLVIGSTVEPVLSDHLLKIIGGLLRLIISHNSWYLVQVRLVDSRTCTKDFLHSNFKGWSLKTGFTVCISSRLLHGFKSLENYIFISSDIHIHIHSYSSASKPVVLFVYIVFSPCISSPK